MRDFLASLPGQNYRAAKRRRALHAHEFSNALAQHQQRCPRCPGLSHLETAEGMLHPPCSAASTRRPRAVGAAFVSPAFQRGDAGPIANRESRGDGGNRIAPPAPRRVAGHEITRDPRSPHIFPTTVTAITYTEIPTSYHRRAFQKAGSGLSSPAPSH